VAILDVDSGLFSADFRASERFGQLVTQVSGRAGRAEKKGEMILQTHHPEHPLLQRLIQQDYSAFAQQLLTERRASQLPPYHYLAIIRAESKNLSAAQAFLKTLMEKFPHSKSVLCFGPVPALMFKKNDRYQLQIYFQTEMRHLLQQYLSKKIIPLIEKHPNKARVRWSIDVDPQEL
jgi:primosomal protein N' (replication factor Y)